MSNSFLTAISNLFLSKEQKKRIKLYRQLSAYIQFVADCPEKVLDSPATVWPMTSKEFANKLIKLTSYYDKTDLPRNPSEQLSLLIRNQNTQLGEKKVRFLKGRLASGQIFNSNV